MDSLDRPYGDQDHEYLVVHNEAPGGDPAPDTGDLVRDEEEAAAAEARAIGGRPTDEPYRANDDDRHDRDPAFIPVEEAGGGYAEGFEQSEGLFLEHVENPPDADTTADAFDLDDPGTDVDPDAEDLVAEDLEAAERGDLPPMEHRDEAHLGTEGGEADELRSTEVTFDPDAPPDDPGRGPGLAWER
jgi:hypothetical protein